MAVAVGSEPTEACASHAFEIGDRLSRREYRSNIAWSAPYGGALRTPVDPRE